MTLDPLLVWIAVACTATLFAHGGIAKLGDRALFEQHLAAYGVPPALTGALAWLLLLYAAAMAWHRKQGHALDCGCGGEPLPLSWALVLRNLVLAALALAAAAPMAARALGLADFLVIAAALVLGTLLHAALHQMLRHRARLSLRS
jgi:hypothetical protein